MENLIIDSNEKREPEVIDKCGVKIPKLDLSSIFIQREALPSNDEKDESEGESYYVEGDKTESAVDSNKKKDKFEQ